MKVRCIADCFHNGREFHVDDMKYHGVYNIELKPGEKLPPHLVPIEVPKPAVAAKPAPAKGKGKSSEDEDPLA